MITMILSTLPYIAIIPPLQLLLTFGIVFLIEGVKALLFIKTNSIIPGVLMQVILLNLSPFLFLPSTFF